MFWYHCALIADVTAIWKLILSNTYSYKYVARIRVEYDSEMLHGFDT